MKVLFFKIPESRHSQEVDTGRQLVKQDKPLGKSWQNEDKILPSGQGQWQSQ